MVIINSLLAVRKLCITGQLVENEEPGRMVWGRWENDVDGRMEEFRYKGGKCVGGGGSSTWHW